MHTELKFVQINLARCFQANESLNTFQGENMIDISVVQEPYHVQGKIIGFPIKTCIVASVSNPKVAILVHSDDILVFPILVKSEIACVRIQWRDKELIVVNVYCAPKGELNSILVEIENLLSSIEGKHLLITGDFNAKNPVWGGLSADRRGEEVINFINANNLNILNDSGSIPTFETVNGKSWIDLSLVSTELTRQINRWEVLEEHNNSDHKYIVINAYKAEKYKERRLTKKGKLKILRDLKDDPWYKITEEPESADDVKYLVDTFYAKFEGLVDKYSKTVTKDKEPKRWWNDELEVERKRVRAMRRRYQKADNIHRAEYKRIYYEAHRQYDEHLKQEKKKTWEEVCATMTSNPFTLPYKIARNQIKKRLCCRA